MHSERWRTTHRGRSARRTREYPPADKSCAWSSRRRPCDSDYLPIKQSTASRPWPPILRPAEQCLDEPRRSLVPNPAHLCKQGLTRARAVQGQVIRQFLCNLRDALRAAALDSQYASRRLTTRSRTADLPADGRISRGPLNQLSGCFFAAAYFRSTRAQAS